jgi:adenylate kinase family enzyme
MENQIRRIAIIGNGGGGKTTLSRALAERYRLEVTHVDSVQYLPGMITRNIEETRKLLNGIADRESWIIDGFGPFDVMERRFQIADKIVFVDFHLWRHYWWCTKRQIKSIWRPRDELPEGCNEGTVSHTIRLFKILWRVHSQIKPKLEEIFDRPDINPKVIAVQNLATWKSVFKGELTLTARSTASPLPHSH